MDIYSKSDHLGESLEKAWIGMYEELIASMSFEFDGNTYSRNELLGLMNGTSVKLRHFAGSAYCEGADKYKNMFAIIYNSLLKLRTAKLQAEELNSIEQLVASENGISTTDFATLLNAAEEGNGISRKYFELKAKIFGVPQISYWDKFAPYIFSGSAKYYTEERTQKLVLNAFNAFSPEFAQIATRFFDEKLIDWHSRTKQCTDNNKVAVNDKLPRIGLHFKSDLTGVFTLAHELGHGVHFCLSQKDNLADNASTKALREAFAIFAEMLVFDAIKAESVSEKKAVTAFYLERIIRSVMENINRYRFEAFAYEQCKKGYIAPSEFADKWAETMSSHLGKSVNTADIANNWAYTQSYFTNPLCVQNDAIATCIALGLFKTYKEKPCGFTATYMHTLKASANESFDKVLKKFGLSTDALWNSAFAIIGNRFAEFEKLF
jgi:oligoendopeptidase F